MSLVERFMIFLRGWTNFQEMFSLPDTGRLVKNS